MDEKLKSIHKDLREKDQIPVITIDQILAKEYSTGSWLIEKLIPDQSITAITGAPGSYKTWLTLEIAKCVSQGLTFLGQFKTEKANVLFVDKENHFRYIQDRLKKLGMQDLPIFYFSRPDDFYLDRDKDYKSLMKLVESLDIKLVIFDSLVRIHSGDENNSKDISKVMSAFRKITSKGATVIVVHHNRKEGIKTQSSTNSIRGSSDILAGLDSLLQVSNPPNEKHIGISQTKLRHDEPVKPFKVEILSDKEKNSISFTYKGDFDLNESQVGEAKESVLEILKEGSTKTRPELIEILSENYSITIIDKALKELEVLETVVKSRGARNLLSFSIKSPVGA